MKFPMQMLWAFDFAPELLRKKGFSAKKLADSGYSLSELFVAGYSVKVLKDIGFTFSEVFIFIIIF
jgi:hypothetical protein